jgi:glycosyltransferase involved in cell wall biosynthesis
MSKSPRIALFYYTLMQDNGIGRANRTIVSHLCDKYEFTVFASRFDNPRPDKIKWVVIPCPRRPVLFAVFLFRLLAWVAYHWCRLVRGWKFDIIQCSDGVVGFPQQVAYVHFCQRLYVARWLPRRDLLTLRGLSRGITYVLEGWREGQVYRRATRVVVPSQGLLRELVTIHGLNTDNITVIPSPVDREEYTQRPEQRQKTRIAWGITEGDVVLCFVALGDFERKGLGPLIEALADQSVARVKLLVVGGEKAALRRYQKLAARLQVASQVVFCGRHSDIRPFLWAADAFILPSRYEVFPAVAMEAAAAGIPLLTTWLNGVEEFAVPGVTGYVIQGTCAHAITDVLKTVTTLPTEELRRLGENARQAISGYTLARFVGAWDGIFAQTLTAH